MEGERPRARAWRSLYTLDHSLNRQRRHAALTPLLVSRPEGGRDELGKGRVLGERLAVSGKCEQTLAIGGFAGGAAHAADAEAEMLGDAVFDGDGLRGAVGAQLLLQRGAADPTAVPYAARHRSALSTGERCAQVST